MPVVNLNCRKCGKETTEYAKNKWRCLHCGAKYRYEKPKPVAAVPSVTINKNKKTVAKEILFQDGDLKITPSLFCDGPAAIPISAILGIENKTEVISVRTKKIIGVVCVFLTALFGFVVPIVSLFEGNFIAFWFWLLIGLSASYGLKADVVLWWRGEMEDEHRYTQVIRLKEGALKEGAELKKQFANAEKMMLFETAVNTAIAAHV